MQNSNHPQAEADRMLAHGFVGRVHEPSPPAVQDDFFADDPLAVEVGAGTVVASVGGDITWNDYVSDHPQLAEWASARWLIGTKLPQLPADLVTTRVALHRLAIYVVAPARHQANGKFGLRWTRGGFGTPFFGDDKQVRVEADVLVVQEGDDVRTSPITTLRAAAEFIGSEIDAAVAAEKDSPVIGDIDEELSIAAEAADFIGNWFGLGVAALEQVRGSATSIDPSRIQLWPGHFDPAMELGDELRRTSFGVSPGDHGSVEPYLFVAPSSPDQLTLDAEDGYWNAESYTGALLSFSALVETDDPLAAAVGFFTAGRDRIDASERTKDDSPPVVS